MSEFASGDREKMRKTIAQVAITSGLVAPNLTTDATVETLHNLLDFVHPRADRPDPIVPDPNDTFDMSDARIVTRPARVNDDRFSARSCNPNQLARMAAIRSAFVMVADTIDDAVEDGRYRAIVMTKLEEACMWAIKGVSHEATR